MSRAEPYFFFGPYTLKVQFLKPTPFKELKGAAYEVLVGKSDTYLGLATGTKRPFSSSGDEFL